MKKQTECKCLKKNSSGGCWLNSCQCKCHSPKVLDKGMLSSKGQEREDIKVTKFTHNSSPSSFGNNDVKIGDFA